MTHHDPPHDTAPACADLLALQVVADLLRQKWAPAILLALAEKPHNYSTLIDNVGAMPVDGNLTAKTFSHTTRRLRAQGLITISRTTQGAPFQVTSAYALTDHGHRLVAKLRTTARSLHDERSSPDATSQRTGAP